MEGKEGCDFKENAKGDATWKCKGGNDHTIARKILKKYFPEYSIPESLKFFTEHGGHCDCEILFNVESAYSTKGDRAMTWLDRVRLAQAAKLTQQEKEDAEQQRLMQEHLAFYDTQAVTRLNEILDNLIGPHEVGRLATTSTKREPYQPHRWTVQSGVYRLGAAFDYPNLLGPEGTVTLRYTFVERDMPQRYVELFNQLAEDGWDYQPEGFRYNPIEWHTVTDWGSLVVAISELDRRYAEAEKAAAAEDARSAKQIAVTPVEESREPMEPSTQSGYDYMKRIIDRLDNRLDLDRQQALVLQFGTYFETDIPF